MNADHPEGLARPVRDETQLTLIDVGPVWRDHWWGMPTFTMGDATPSHRLTINFLTLDALRTFSDAIGVRLTSSSNSMWYPPQRLDEPKDWAYIDE